MPVPGMPENKSNRHATEPELLPSIRAAGANSTVPMTAQDNDYLKRLETKVNRAIEHIEKLTVENDQLRRDNTDLADELRSARKELNSIRLDSRDRATRVRDKIRSILHKVDSLEKLS